jgi:tetratricopeptide (TPR) repeat protein
MSDYAVTRIDEVEELDDGRCRWRPIRHHLGVTAFGVNSWTARETGERIINEHNEDEPDSDEEVYLVTEGCAEFQLDDDRVTAPTGTFVFARPGVKRTAFALEPMTTIVVIGGTPGKAYEPSGWEIWAPLNRLYEAGRYEEAAERGRALVAAYPGYPAMLYNLACCESLAGRTSDALEHVSRAIEMSERFLAYAQEDSDLDPIREQPAFQEILKAHGL